ncbi:hypothetical protein GCM10029978_046010 [Actinoallomurus acanthiterrae]
MTDLPQQRPAHVIALTDQIHAAIRDKDAERLADTVRPLYFRDPDAARAILVEGLQNTIGTDPGQDEGPAGHDA